MFTQSFLICFALLLLIARTLAQCTDPTFVPCTAPDSGGGGGDTDGANAAEIDDLLASLDGAADVSVDGGDKRKLFRRQDNGGAPNLCCNPSIECLVTDGIPFCYNQATTEYIFPDGSYGFGSNSTYYAADGSLLSSGINPSSTVDVAGGTFSPAAPTVTSGFALSSNVGKISVEAKPTSTASAPNGPLATGIVNDSGGSSGGQSTPTVSGLKEPTSGTSPVVKSTPVPSSSSQAQGQQAGGGGVVGFGSLAAAAGFAVVWIVGMP